MTAPVRIGVIGTGFVSDFYMQGLQDLAGWEIPVAASTDAGSAQRFVQKWKLPEWSSDVEGVVKRKDLDLIVIGAPNFVHRDLVVSCAKAGKNVVCTKPLGRNAAEAKEMLEAVRAAGVMHGYAETEVFSPAVVKAREAISNGAIGKVLTVRSREAHPGPHDQWFMTRSLAGGGAMLDMGCHTIEAARYFIGKEVPIVEVMAWGDTLMHGDRTDAEDNAILLCRFADGQIGQSELSWTARGGLDLRNEVYGTEGAIFTDITRETPLRIFSNPGVEYVVEKSESQRGWLFPPIDEAWIYGYRAEMKHFIECVATNTTPRETFEDGYVVNRVLDAGYVSMKSKKWEPVGS